MSFAAQKLKQVVTVGSTILLLGQPLFAAASPQKAPKRANKTLEIERLTLLLVDRLPTQAERDFGLSKGRQSLLQLADSLITGPEFFHRQALYWQTQLNNSPAWKWEGQSNPYELNYGQLPLENRRNILWYVPPSASSSLARSCTGVWTTHSQNGFPEPCSCDETIDVLPFWDKSSSMRVCPTAASESGCGNALEKCFPVDRRLSPRSTELEVDKDSAGGLAIGRLLSDLAVANGRSIALRIIAKQKWSQLPSLPFRTAMSQSSLALITQWNRILQDEISAQLVHHLEFPETAEWLDESFTKPTFENTRRYGFRTLGRSSAENYLLSVPKQNLQSSRPLRFSRLNKDVWKWNDRLIFSCATPYVAQQIFHLPLPHPDKAKTASYFCSGCHMELDFITKDIKEHPGKPESSKSEKSNTANCAVEHALRFLVGYNVAESGLNKLRTIGKRSFETNSESLADVIRDLAIAASGSTVP